MMQYNLQGNLLTAIRNSVPSETNVARYLMEVLCLGKEAVYRRLRGEVPFTLDEAATISGNLGLSLDNMICLNSARNKPFQLQVISHVNPLEIDYTHMEEYIDLISQSRKDPYTEIGSAANIFPPTLFLRYKHLTKFFMFKWLHQSSNTNLVKSLDDIRITDRQADIHKRYIEESMYISNTYYIWDNMVFQYLVNDIKYFSELNFITKEDTLAVKEDLLIFTDDMEIMAAKGQNEAGTKLQFYLSNINFESTYSYLQTNSYRFSYLKVFTLDLVVSKEPGMFDNLKSWIQSLKRLSTLISESGEMQRVCYFNKQRELINTIR